MIDTRQRRDSSVKPHRASACTTRMLFSVGTACSRDLDDVVSRGPFVAGSRDALNFVFRRKLAGSLVGSRLEIPLRTHGTPTQIPPDTGPARVATASSVTPQFVAATMPADCSGSHDTQMSSTEWLCARMTVVTTPAREYCARLTVQKDCTPGPTRHCWNYQCRHKPALNRAAMRL